MQNRTSRPIAVQRRSNTSIQQRRRAAGQQLNKGDLGEAEETRAAARTARGAGEGRPETAQQEDAGQWRRERCLGQQRSPTWARAAGGTADGARDRSGLNRRDDRQRPSPTWTRAARWETAAGDLPAATRWELVYGDGQRSGTTLKCQISFSIE